MMTCTCIIVHIQLLVGDLGRGQHDAKLKVYKGIRTVTINNMQ